MNATKTWWQYCGIHVAILWYYGTMYTSSIHLCWPQYFKHEGKCDLNGATKLQYTCRNIADMKATQWLQQQYCDKRHVYWTCKHWFLQTCIYWSWLRTQDWFLRSQPPLCPQEWVMRQKSSGSCQTWSTFSDSFDTLAQWIRSRCITETWVIRMSQARFRLKTGDIKSVWANKPSDSSKGSKLLFPVIIQIQSNCTCPDAWLVSFTRALHFFSLS